MVQCFKPLGKLGD